MWRSEQTKKKQGKINNISQKNQKIKRKRKNKQMQLPSSPPKIFYKKNFKEESNKCKVKNSKKKVPTLVMFLCVQLLLKRGATEPSSLNTVRKQNKTTGTSEPIRYSVCSSHVGSPERFFKSPSRPCDTCQSGCSRPNYCAPACACDRLRPTTKGITFSSPARTANWSFPAHVECLKIPPSALENRGIEDGTWTATGLMTKGTGCRPSRAIFHQYLGESDGTHI